MSSCGCHGLKTFASRRTRDGSVVTETREQQEQPVESCQKPHNSLHNRFLSTQFVLYQNSETIRVRVMSFFNSIGCVIHPSRLCDVNLTWPSTRIAGFFFMIAGVLCNVRGPGVQSDPQRQLLPHFLMPHQPTLHLPYPHLRQLMASRSHSISAALSLRQLSSRATSRLSSCCQNMSISWSGWL